MIECVDDDDDDDDEKKPLNRVPSRIFMSVEGSLKRGFILARE